MSTRRKKGIERLALGEKHYPLRYVDKKIYTCPWDNHPLKGFCYMLWAYGSITPLTLQDIGGLTFWGWRCMRNQSKIIKKSCLRDHVIIGRRKGKTTFFLTNKYAQIPFDALWSIICDSYYRKTCGPNKPEETILGLLNKLFPKSNWRFTGDITKENQLNGKYPDFTNHETKQIIEFFGPWHREEHTEMKDHLHERQRKEVFAKKGYKCLCIWDNEMQDMKEVEKRIINFCNDTEPLGLSEAETKEFLKRKY